MKKERPHGMPPRPPGKPVAIVNDSGPGYPFSLDWIRTVRSVREEIRGDQVFMWLAGTPLALITDVLCAPLVGMAWIVRRIMRAWPNATVGWSITVSLWRMCWADRRESKGASLVHALPATPFAFLADAVFLLIAGPAWIVRQFRAGETARGAFGISVIGGVFMAAGLSLVVSAGGLLSWLGAGFIGACVVCFIAWFILFMRDPLFDRPEE